MWGSIIIGEDAAAAVRRDDLDNGTGRHAVVAEADATRSGSVILSADVAAVVRCNGMDAGARCRVVVVKGRHHPRWAAPLLVRTQPLLFSASTARMTESKFLWLCRGNSFYIFN